MTNPGWEAFLEEHFAAYLLPFSMRKELPVDVAQRFLERLTGRPHQLDLLRWASLLATRQEELRSFALDWLPALVRVLPSRTVVERRVWEGGIQGRLDVKGTLACRLGGRPTAFVTRTRQRQFDLPETILVKAVARRLLQGLTDLREANVLKSYGWGEHVAECEGELRRVLEATVLRKVPDPQPSTPLSTHHRQAAQGARHPCYRLAATWDAWLIDGLDSADPSRIAALVAEGALTPLEAEQRFELAVAVKLVKSLDEYLASWQPQSWRLERSIVAPSGMRPAIAHFERDDGASINVYYDQSVLEPGPRTASATAYLGSRGRSRPDLTITFESAHGDLWATVVEVKSMMPLHELVPGLNEAFVYASEHAAVLKRWPQAILVAPPRMRSPPSPDHAVIASGWADWVPREILASLVPGL